MSVGGVLAIYPAGIPAGGRTILGTYRATTGVVAGAMGAAVNIGSLFNPLASGRNLYVKRLQLLTFTLAAPAAGPFVIHAARNADAAAGAALTAVLRDQTGDSAAVGVARSSPTGTLAASDFWNAIYFGTFSNTAAIPFVDIITEYQPYEEMVLRPGEGLLVRVDSGASGWDFGLNYLWQEGTGP